MTLSFLSGDQKMKSTAKITNYDRQKNLLKHSVFEESTTNIVCASKDFISRVQLHLN